MRSYSYATGRLAQRDNHCHSSTSSKPTDADDNHWIERADHARTAQHYNSDTGPTATPGPATAATAATEGRNPTASPGAAVATTGTTAGAAGTAASAANATASLARAAASSGPTAAAAATTSAADATTGFARSATTATVTGAERRATEAPWLPVLQQAFRDKMVPRPARENPHRSGGLLQGLP